MAYEQIATVSKYISLTIPTASWTGSDPYTQIVTVLNSTANTKVDLQPSEEIYDQLAADNVGYLAIKNVDGTLTAVAKGGKPSVDLTVQVTYNNVVPVSKTWLINKSPDVSTGMLVTINFTSNGESFDQFQVDAAMPGIIYLKNGYGLGYQYDSSSWSFGEAYRTVVFETVPTGELLTWLQANAVPQ